MTIIIFDRFRKTVGIEFLKPWWIPHFWDQISASQQNPKIVMWNSWEGGHLLSLRSYCLRAGKQTHEQKNAKSFGFVHGYQTEGVEILVSRRVWFESKAQWRSRLFHVYVSHNSSHNPHNVWYITQDTTRALSCKRFVRSTWSQNIVRRLLLPEIIARFNTHKCTKDIA